VQEGEENDDSIEKCMYKRPESGSRVIISWIDHKPSREGAAAAGDLRVLRSRKDNPGKCINKGESSSCLRLILPSGHPKSYSRPHFLSR